MNAQRLLEMLMDMDSCIIDSRPSQFGEAAELVRWMARQIMMTDDGDMTPDRQKKYLGAYESVDLSEVHRHPALTGKRQK